jgi:type III pantothenate kinase
MLLAIDIGNTHTVFGVFDGEHLKADWRVSSNPLRTEDEAGTQLQQFLAGSGIHFPSITDIGISSVVPNLTDIYDHMARKYFGIKPLIIGSHLDLGIAIRYTDPSAVGADRLCNAIAGYARYGGPLIIVDFGTATTYDVVGSQGDYLGGVIAPGIETSAADLHRRAAKLPKIELHLPASVLGVDTVSSMQAGILYGAIDALEGMIARLQKDVEQREGKKATVIATGGFSEFIRAQTTVISACEPALVLDGVRRIVGRVRAPA